METTAEQETVKPKPVIEKPKPIISLRTDDGAFGAYKRQVIYVNKANTSAFIYFHTFQNCQVFTFGSYNAIAYLPNIEDILKECVNCAGYKPLMMIDVKKETVKHVKKIFTADNIVFETPYTSPTGSAMVVFMLKTGWLLDKK